jgi:HEAT repeat protein
VPALLQVLSADQSVTVRGEAADALWKIKDPSAVEPLLSLLASHQKSRVRAEVAWILGEYRHESEKVIPGLLKALNDEDEVCERASISLVGFGSSAFPQIARFLKNPDAKGRGSALWVIATSSRDSERKEQEVRPLLPVLEQAMKDVQGTNRELAAAALGRLGPAGRPALPVLIQALTDASIAVRVNAARAINQIEPGHPVVLPFLLRAIESQDRDTRCMVAIELGELGPRAKAAVPALIKGLRDQDKDVRLTSLNALGRIGPGASAAIPEIKKILGGELPGDKTSAANALEWIQSK